MKKQSCMIGVVKTDRGAYEVQQEGECQPFEVTRAKNKASIANFATNIGASYNVWNESIKDFEKKTIHDVNLKEKIPIEAFFGEDHVQLTAKDKEGITWSAMINREQQVEGKSTFNQVAIIGKCLDQTTHSPDRDSMKSYVKVNTDTIQYVEIREISHYGFKKGENIPATDQFVYLNDVERKKRS